MPAVSGPILLTAQEFAAQPQGVDTSKLLKDQSTLAAQANAGATSLSVTSKQGSAPARNDPKATAIVSYGIDSGDIVFVGDGSAADPMEYTFATGPFTGGGPFALPVSPALVSTHPVGSPVSIGPLQQELLSAGEIVEQYCQQPLSPVTHPLPQWLPNEILLGQVWAVVDVMGYPTLFVPYVPIISVTSIQSKRLGGSAATWTTEDLNQWEVLTDRIIGPQGQFMRGEFVIFKVTYKSGLSPIPDDVKEATRLVAASGLRMRGGQAVVSSTGKLTTREEKAVGIPPMAKDLLNTYRAVR